MENTHPAPKRRKILTDEDDDEWTVPSVINSTSSPQTAGAEAESMELSQPNQPEPSTTTTTGTDNNGDVKAPVQKKTKSKSKVKSPKVVDDDDFASLGVLTPLVGHRSIPANSFGGFANFFGIKKKDITVTKTITDDAVKVEDDTVKMEENAVDSPGIKKELTDMIDTEINNMKVEDIEDVVENIIGDLKASSSLQTEEEEKNNNESENENESENDADNNSESSQSENDKLNQRMFSPKLEYEDDEDEEESSNHTNANGSGKGNGNSSGNNNSRVYNNTGNNTDNGQRSSSTQTVSQTTLQSSTSTSSKPVRNPFDMMLTATKRQANAMTSSKTTTSKTTTSKTSTDTSSPMPVDDGGASLLSPDVDVPTTGTQFGDDNFNPLDGGWVKGQKVPYSALANLFKLCEATTKRLQIISYVSDFFRSVITLSPHELLQCIYLCVNQVYPAFEGRELGIGDQILLKSLAETCGTTLALIKDQYRDTGDLGVIAEDFRLKQRTLMRPVHLTVSGVFNKLREIADISGAKSADRKKEAIKQLIVASKGHEARYITRSLQGNLRIHLALLSVIKALARAVILTPPTLPQQPITSMEDSPLDDASEVGVGETGDDDDEDNEDNDDDEGCDLFDAEGKKRAINPKARSKVEIEIDAAHKLIESAYNDCPSFDKLTDAILTLPLNQIHKKCSLTPGLPIKVMLGKPARGVMEVIKKFEGRKFTLEYKYDGERAQIHMLPDGSIRIYSRHQENNTSKYPDIILNLPKACNSSVSSFIMDAEVVAWDPKDRKILPFQTLSTRKRKDVKHEDVSVQVIVFGFDLLYLNGVSYMKKSFEQRRTALHASFTPTNGIFEFAKYLDSTDPEDIDTFLQQAVNDSCEGLMVKPLDLGAKYVPDKRNWIKVKKDYLDGVGDTLDLVPLGAWYGKGKRTGTYGAFLMFCYNDTNSEDTFQSVVRIGTGFKDTDLDELTKLLKPNAIDNPQSDYEYSTQRQLTPDVWFKPTTVWEVKCADLSISPEHKAAIGQVHESNGISIRFPRFIRLRPDKQPEHATTADQISDMYMAQSVVQNSGIATGRRKKGGK